MSHKRDFSYHLKFLYYLKLIYAWFMLLTSFSLLKEVERTNLNFCHQNHATKKRRQDRARPKTSKRLKPNCPHSCKYVQTHRYKHTNPQHTDIFHTNTWQIQTTCMMWFCRIKDAIYLGPIQQNAKKCPRTKSHSPLPMQIGCPNIFEAIRHTTMILMF